LVISPTVAGFGSLNVTMATIMGISLSLAVGHFARRAPVM
jgi:hypothetical protein